MNLISDIPKLRTFLFIFSTHRAGRGQARIRRRSDQGVTKLNEGPLATAAIIHIYCHLYLLSTISYWYNTTRLLIHPNPPRPNHCCPWQPWALKECCISKLIYISRDLIVAENLIGLPGEDWCVYFENQMIRNVGTDRNCCSTGGSTWRSVAILSLLYQRIDIRICLFSVQILAIFLNWFCYDLLCF